MPVHRLTFIRLSVLALSQIIMPAHLFAQPPRADFFVSPSGNDAWSGKLPEPNAAKTDGPFATITRARDAVRAMMPKTAPITVLLRGGFYSIKDTLLFTSADSGTAQAPILYAAYPDEKPVLSGGVRITDWKKTMEGTYSCKLPSVEAGQWRFSQLYVNNERRYRPRLPEDSFFFVTEATPPSPRSEGKGFDRLRYRPGDIYASWQHREDIEVLPFHIWTMSRFGIAELDAKESLVTFAGHTPSTEFYFAIPQNGRYLVENVQEALSDPGEWYLERKTGTLTYLTRDKEDPIKPEKTEIIAPRTERLLDIQDAHHLTFRGLIFAHTGWNLPPTGHSYPQAEVDISAAVTLTGAREVAFEKCEIRNTGNWAIHFARGSQRCRLSDCELVDLGAGAVKIGETNNEKDPEKQTGHITIEDCLIAEGGRIHPAGIGVWIGHSANNNITHNEIVDFYYTGISVGWSWGYGESGAHHNTIAYNHIHTIGQGVLSDMGGIYTLGLSPGSTLHHNLIHDIRAIEYGGWGIYFDEGTTGMVAENNVVYNTKSAPFHQHYGKENIVRNNILAFGQEAQLMRTRAEDHLSFTLSHNIIYYTEGPLLGSNWSGPNFRLSENVYWNAAGKPVTFAGKTFAEWQATGQDAGSRVLDPLFVAPDKGDFSLKPDSPAIGLGFHPIDMSTVGRRTTKPYAGKVPPAFPPPPPPQPIQDNFETTPAGQKPSGSLAIYEDAEVPTATIRVTDEVAASGKHSLKFTDAPGQKASYNPHLVYNVKFDSGKIMGRFALRMEAGAVFFHEWRDNTNPYNVGPSLRVDGQGGLYMGGTKRADLPLSQWVTVEITCLIGDKADGTWSLTVRPPGRARALNFKDLPCGSGKAFDRLRWWGFVADGTTGSVFYIDDVSLAPGR